MNSADKPEPRARGRGVGCRIALGTALRSAGGGLPIGRRGDDLARPSRFTSQPLFDEVDGEPIKQFGMARPFALRPKSAVVLTMPSAEQHLPDAVDRHARRERMIRAWSPTGRARADSPGAPAGSGGNSGGRAGRQPSPLALRSCRVPG